MRDVAGYLGIAYADRGRREATGLDCWGLLRLFYAEQMGITLPCHTGRYLSSDNRAQTCALARSEIDRAWQPVAEPQWGDAVVLNVLGRPFHVGICLAKPDFLHTLSPDQGAVIDSLRSPAWARRIDGFYRYQDKDL